MRIVDCRTPASNSVPSRGVAKAAAGIKASKAVKYLREIGLRTFRCPEDADHRNGVSEQGHYLVERVPTGCGPRAQRSIKWYLASSFKGDTQCREEEEELSDFSVLQTASGTPSEEAARDDADRS